MPLMFHTPPNSEDGTSSVIRKGVIIATIADLRVDDGRVRSHTSRPGIGRASIEQLLYIYRKQWQRLRNTMEKDGVRGNNHF